MSLLNLYQICLLAILVQPLIFKMRLILMQALVFWLQLSSWFLSLI